MIDKKVILLICGVILTGSIEHISIPLMVTYFNSLYFIIMTSSLHGCLNFGFLLLLLTKGQFRKPREIKTTLLAGSFNAIMSMCFIYSANPERTPVMIQSIFLGLAILPTVIFRKYIIHKIITYDRNYIIPSLSLLILSIILVMIPLLNQQYDWSKSYWILGYILAIILLSLDGTLQEKYIIDTNDNTLTNKISFAFYTSLCQVMTLIMMFWIEYIFGYTNTPFNAFFESAKIFVSNFWTFCILELFIIDCLVLYLLTVHLNSISTNYNMILTNLTNQSVAIFFIIFPQLNHGIQYPIFIVICSLILNIISVFLWMKGEKNKQIPSMVSSNDISLEEFNEKNFDYYEYNN